MANVVRVHVQVVPTLPERTVAVPPELVEQTASEATVEFGARSTTCHLAITPGIGSTIQLSTSVADRLVIDGDMRINARWEGSRLALGPVIGVIADTHEKPASLFSEQTKLFHELSQEAKRRGAILFIFTPYGVNFAKQTIKGYIASSRDDFGSWQRKRFPFPAVVYDRTFYRGAEEKVTDRMTARLARQKGVKLVNSEIGDKWKVHQELSHQSELRPNLPETILIGENDGLERFLDHHRLVYLKPARGSQGRGIIRIERGLTGGFVIQYQNAEREIRRSFAGLSSLRVHLRRLFGGRHYLAQQGIDLIKHDGSLVDLRLIVQKNAEGNWGVTGMAARVGRRGSSVTNLHRGGHAVPIPSLLATHFPLRAKKLTAQIKRLGCSAAASIEKAYGPLGELGIDLGLDRRGRVWYIEANPKPGRRVFLLIGAPETRRKTIVRPLEYAMTLAGFPPSAARRDQDGN
ncbi:MAG: YheC/YheD family protein [Bacillota bacterium]